ncbi:MAG: right-handed parallel beta-helix repeat-containing protein [Chloroflexi bacterium]|nr:right-handed parallel beta-helix repeat-containing protein [Chloroflexota bacterium]
MNTQTISNSKTTRWGIILGIVCLSILLAACEPSPLGDNDITAVGPLAVAAQGGSSGQDIYYDIFVDVNHPNCDDANPGTPELPLCSIQAAADRTTPGTHVHVREGTYYEQVEVRTSGTTDALIAFVTDNEERVVIDSPGEACFDLRNVEYIKIHGFELTGAWMPSEGAAPRTDTDEIAAGHAGGIRAFPLDENGFGAQNSIFTNNVIHDNDAGIWLVYSHNNVISDNVIYGSGEASIRIKRGDNNLIYNNLIFNNGLNEHWGITFYCATGTTIHHNTVVELTGGAFYLYEGTSNLNGAQPGEEGFCKPGNETKIYDNIGVVIGDTAGDSAPMVIGSSSTTDRDPILEELYGPLNNEYHHNLWFDKYYPENVVSWGDFSECFTWEYYDLLTLEEFQLKHAGYGAFSIALDPLFVDPLHNDFRLSENSPAKGIASDGKDLGVIYDDLPAVEYASLPGFLVTPTEAALTPSPQTNLLPVGFVADTPDDLGLTLFDLAGNPLGEWHTPGLMRGAPGYVHVAGGFQGGSNLPPLAYYAFKDGHRSLVLNVNDALTLLREQAFAKVAGVPGQPILAFSTVSEDFEAWNTKLFIGTVDTISNTQPVLKLDGPQNEGLMPLAVRVKDGQAVGVWYTFEAWGIGGEFLFRPRFGLYYLDLTNGQNQKLIGQAFAPSSLSPDQFWVAYAQNNGLNIGPLTIRNLTTGAETAFPLLPGNDRGAGGAVFSPDNSYVAWMEGSGHWMAATPPTFQATIRIASTSGAIITEFPVSAINGIGGVANVLWMEPVGWMDGQTLILQIGPNPSNPVALAQIRFDGSGLAYLAPGSFAGLVYP